jgi:hypothetical protein
MILHLSQIFLTDALTFISLPSGLCPGDNATSAGIQCRALDLDAVTRFHGYGTSPKLLGDVRRYFLSILESHFVKPTRQKLEDFAVQ